MSSEETAGKALWIQIEEKIQGLGDSEFGGGGESAVQKIAGDLGITGNAGYMIQLRKAVGERIQAGRPLIKDLEAAIEALALADISDAYSTTMQITGKIGQTFPGFRSSVYRNDVLAMVEKKKLDLQIAEANNLGADKGVRYLISEGLAEDVILSSLGIDEAKLKEVKAAIAAELAEKKRVEDLLAAVSDQPEEDQLKHLINNDASDELIMEVAGVGQDKVDAAKKAMEEELKEKQRLAEEEAARKKAEAEGPPLEEIPPDQMLEHLEAIDDILGFSDVEEEIRQMCEQSSIPKCLVDIAVSDRDRLAELEKQAEEAS